MFAFKLEAWRARSGPVVERWLRAVGEVEALSSLAGHAYDNPGDVYPRVEPGRVRVEAVAVGHPLIARQKCVVNDVALGGETGPSVLMVSGSNMSGKSTLLRAVGVNVVLALAGGVVRAASLSLTPVALGATMRVQDSLQAGRSRFFAEVTKVRQLLDIKGRKLHIFRDPVSQPAGLGSNAYKTRLALDSKDSVSPLAAPNVTIRVADLLP